MAVLADLKCTVCQSGDFPLDREEIAQYHDSVPDWQVSQEDGIDKLKRVYKFRNYASAMKFAHAVAEAADAEGHHPVITLEWGKVSVVWWTHKIGGLHRNDFIMAARSDALYQEGQVE
jgi:4a-hydroxytetrahydrobiopterin dehydratase